MSNIIRERFPSSEDVGLIPKMGGRHGCRSMASSLVYEALRTHGRDIRELILIAWPEEPYKERSIYILLARLSRKLKRHGFLIVREVGRLNKKSVYYLMDRQNQDF